MENEHYEQYEHHGKLVTVLSAVKGKHRLFCLCWNCANFHPDDRENNCPIANELYELCVKHNLVTPVFECPKFIIMGSNPNTEDNK